MDKDKTAEAQKGYRQKKKSGKFLMIVIPLILVIAILLSAVLLNWNIIIDIKGNNPTEINMGETYTPLEAEAHLALSEQRLLPLDVKSQGAPDTAKAGEYTVQYSSKFLTLEKVLDLKVIVKDTEPPVVTLNGEEKITISSGDSFTDPGVKATDNKDGDITDTVAVEGTVDTTTSGEYTLKYTATDKAGNATSVTRTVVVEAKKQPDQIAPGTKTIYLTFDDGPGPYTDKLLDICKAHNVKVTFFVTGRGDSSIIKREAAEGHTVAVHTYTHDYASIYASDEAYLSDFKAMENLIYEQTGTKTTVFRFPGGSSNTVSKKYSVGIMSRLTKSMTDMGYQYYDWNITSGDAGAVTTSDAVYQNVVQGIANNSSDVSIVLQHDIKDFSVDAVERIISWGLDNGYAFLPITPSTPVSHHGVNN